MKISKVYLITLIMGVMLVSCTENPSPPPDTTGEETYTSYIISFSEGGITRGMDDPDAGTPIEKEVNRIGIIILDEANADVHYDFRNISSFTQGSGANANKYTGNFAVKTTTGMKTVVVVVNPTTNVEDQLRLYSRRASDNVGFGLQDADFINNVVGGGIVMSGKTTGVNLTMVQTEATALASPTPINVYRNLSKVIVALRPSAVSIGGANFSDIKYTLGAKAKDAYFSAQVDGSNNPTTLFDNINANFSSHFTPIDTDVIPDGAYIPTLVENAVTNKTGVGFYALENVPKISVPVYGATTSILIKAVVTPTSPLVATYNVDNKATTVTTGSFTTGNSFYVYRPTEEYWTVNAYNQAIVSGHTYSLKATDFDYYEDGVCFFPAVAVRDDNKKLGVERNHLYVATITKIHKIGEPAQPYEPEDPVVDETYMTLTVSIYDWVYGFTEHELF